MIKVEYRSNADRRFQVSIKKEGKKPKAEIKSLTKSGVIKRCHDLRITMMGEREMCYIEQRFKSLASQKSEGSRLITKWETDKEVYTSYTEMTAFDFQHYSMHDKSHSVRILQNIELLLGRGRVDLLGVGDLWLLLQAAYFHDIGMSLTSKDMDELWEENSEFRAFLSERLREGRYRDNAELYDAIDYYNQVDRVLNKKSDFEAVLKSDPTGFESDWPIRLIQNIQYISAEYIRRHHAERSQEYFQRIFEENKTYTEGVIDERLYALVGTISGCHTKDFGRIFDNLPYEEVAMGDEHIHPRFAAAMLRIGDLLDMDNNRFNLRILEHRGTLPPQSMVHLNKHKALRHLEIDETIIYASASSDDFDTCLETRRWYNWIDSEVSDLIRNWNRLAPKALKGCLLKKCDLRVYLKGALFTAQNFNHFNFDSRKMQKLLIGDNIYDCRLDCLREYIQNAIDATKVCLWKRLKENDINSPIINNGPLDELLPCDLKEDAFLSMPIEVLFSYESSETSLADDKICIEIKDRGIGMDKAYIDGITTIGKGWRTREEYQDVFTRGPKWLQPTGGFGIGIQSAFMLTDQVEYETYSEKESTGHRIRLVSPEYGGNVTREGIAGSSFAHGTTVTFCVDAMKFMNYEELGISKDLLGPENDRDAADSETLLNMFNQQNILRRAIAICKKYLADQMPNAIFPIYIGEKNNTCARICSPYLYKQPPENKKIRHPLEKLEFTSCEVIDKQSNERYRYLYHIDINGEKGWREKSSRIIIWNTQYMDCVCFSFSNEQFTTGNRSEERNVRHKLDIAFKNIAVSKDPQDLVCCKAFLDIMGERAENCLQVSRSKLKSDFHDQLKTRLNTYLEFGLNKLIAQYLEVKKADWEEKSKQQAPGTIGPSVGQNSVNADLGFVRMVFCALAYLPLSENARWKSAISGIEGFGQEVLNTMGTTVKTLHVETEPADSEAVRDESFCDGQAAEDAPDKALDTETKENAGEPLNMIEYCIDKWLNSKGSQVFFCTDDFASLTVPKRLRDQLAEEIGPVERERLYNALATVAKPPVPSVQKEKMHQLKEEKTNIIYNYLLQTQEKIFGAVWGDAVFGTHTETWKEYGKVSIEGRRYVDDSNGKIYFIAPFTVYFQQEQTPPDDNEPPKMHQKIFCNDVELYKKYPIAVSRVPFQVSLPQGQWAIISPMYTALEENLEKMGRAHDASVEDAIRKVLNENRNFLALVDWVYRYQYPVDGNKRSKRNITEIYLKWVMNIYYSREE